MIEMVVCTILLSTVMLVLAPGLIAVQRQRQAARFDVLTLIELNNIATQLHAGVQRDGFRLSDWYTQRYQDTTLEIVPVEAAQNSFGQPVRIAISRPAVDGYPDLQRSLVIWMPEDVQ